MAAAAPVISGVEEFAFIAKQLQWLDDHLRAQPQGVPDARMASALNALTCAQAVITELALIGRTPVNAAAEAPAPAALSTD